METQLPANRFHDPSCGQSRIQTEGLRPLAQRWPGWWRIPQLFRLGRMEPKEAGGQSPGRGLPSCPLIFAVGKAKLVGWMGDQVILISSARGHAEVPTPIHRLRRLVSSLFHDRSNYSSPLADQSLLHSAHINQICLNRLIKCHPATLT